MQEVLLVHRVMKYNDDADGTLYKDGINNIIKLHTNIRFLHNTIQCSTA